MTFLTRIERMMRAAGPGPIAGQVRAWEELKARYRLLYRRELAFAEEGPRAGSYGWPES